ncbi:hypothetical protein [Nannocystis pusilla]|uniref:hypothetical protein n=1 Tax=Nannocystis pusilla TaxID=889268 RepID=UPI003B77E970
MLVTLTIAGLLLAPAPAPPSPRPLREALRVEPGATCLTADALADAATTWLGRDTIDPSVARIDVRGDPARPHSVAIALEIRGELVERTLDPPRPTCSDLHALVGLAIAIAVDAAVLEGLGYEVIEPGEGACRRRKTRSDRRCSDARGAARRARDRCDARRCRWSRRCAVGRGSGCCRGSPVAVGRSSSSGGAGGSTCVQGCSAATGVLARSTLTPW